MPVNEVEVIDRVATRTERVVLLATILELVELGHLSPETAQQMVERSLREAV
jgi:hypothetical protein